MSARSTADIVALAKTRAGIRGCEECGLSATRTQAVPLEGKPPVHVAFVGEAPGAREDEQGRPFVGASGRLLDDALAKGGLSRNQVMILNAVCCRPPGNREPTTEERMACAPWMWQQIRLTGAWLVVLVGATAMRSVFGTAMYGWMMPVFSEGRVWVGIRHPAYYLRRFDRDPFYKDIDTIAQLVLGYEMSGPWPVDSPTADERAPAIRQMLNQGGGELWSHLLGETVRVTSTPTPYAWSIGELAEIRRRGLPLDTVKALQQVKKVMGGMVWG